MRMLNNGIGDVLAAVHRDRLETCAANYAKRARGLKRQFIQAGFERVCVADWRRNQPQCR